MTHLQEFCGFKNGSSFILWRDDDFGDCFKLLCLVCPANFLLVCSSIFFARRKRQIFEFLEPRLYILSKLQALICALIFLESVIEASCSWSLRSYHPPVYLLSSSLVALAWISNAFTVWRNRHVFLLKKCYPTVHVTAIILAFLMSCIQLYSVIVRMQGSDANSLFIHEYGIIIRFVLEVIFVILLIPPACGSYNRIGLNTDSSTAASTGIQGSTERDAILRSASRGTFYSSTQCVTDDLGIAEDSSNFISRLTFWWVRPMMKKGHKGNLRSTEDLFLLPQSLSTKKLRILFSDNFDLLETQKNQDTTTNQVLDDSYSSDRGYTSIIFLPGVQKSVSDPNFRFRYGSSSIRRLTSTNSAEYSEIEVPDITVPKVSNQRSLLSALHHSFGLQYYCIGLLKLTGDALSFAGPLLLHALVSFMENRQVRPGSNTVCLQACVVG